jgi:predicted glycoside hydrolase/deacetylase ChbG (UPF0249 family)
MTADAAGPRPDAACAGAGLLIVNADDWGRTTETTDRIAECVRQGTVTSVSAMVFMEDSERAAAMARARGIEAGLHLNLTTPLSGAKRPGRLLEHQQALAQCLRRHRLAQVLFHPRLVGSFEYVVAAQLDEFRRLYGAQADRVDGHHHMHLCANVLLQRLLPAGTLVRRNFSFQASEKSAWNRWYRRLIDGVLARRHRVVDFFFALSPLEPWSRLQSIFALAGRFSVEIETHPIEPDEYRFLTDGEMWARTRDVRILPPSAVPRSAGVGAGDD